MRHQVTVLLVLGMALVGCTSPLTPTESALGRDAPFPPTWTPIATSGPVPVPTLVVEPTATWDGTLPPPSELEVPRMLPAELNRLLERGDAVVVVDVRSSAAYARAHVSGAAHIPLGVLQERIGELDRDVTVVLYDLSLQRHVSLKAAMLLYESGFTKVLALDGGFSRWYAGGYPIEGTLLTPTPERVDPPWTVTPLPTSTPLSETPTAVPTATESR